MKYKCSKCKIEENIGHVNPMVEPYLCEACWKRENGILSKQILEKKKR